MGVEVASRRGENRSWDHGGENTRMWVGEMILRIVQWSSEHHEVTPGSSLQELPGVAQKVKADSKFKNPECRKP